jgi:division protein CdvB (Snf7/Vps24/ESCRT-III family)
MAAVVQQRARRSSVADWQKYQDLAAQLEEARSQLQSLDSSDDEVSFAALLEDN